MTNEEKLSKLLSLMESDGLTEAKFLKYFKMVIDLIKKLQDNNKKTIENIDSRYSDKVDEIKRNYGGDISKMKKEIMGFATEKVINILKESRIKMAELDEKVASIKDGKDADETRVAENASKLAQEALKPLIPTIEAIESDLPKLGEKIRDGLELLKGDDRLDMSAIKDLEEELDKIKRMKAQGSFVGGGGTTGAHICKAYDLSGQLNGVLKTFSMPAIWRLVAIHFSSFPYVARPDIDYTFSPSAHTITFTSEIDASSTLASGQTVIITYAE